MSAPSSAAIQARGDALAVHIARGAGTAGQSFQRLAEGLLSEIERLLVDEGAEDPGRPDVLLKSDFGNNVWISNAPLGSVKVLLADPRGLAPEQPASVLAAELGDQLYDSNDRKMLVLGDVRKGFFEAPAVAALTRQWGEDQRRVVADRERLAREGEERERRRYDESPQGQVAKLQGILNGLIDAVKARPSCERVDRLEAEITGLRAQIAALKTRQETT